MEAHYFMHDIFLPANSLLDNAGKLRNSPAVIVQGRYDAVCPIVSADDLHHAWPEALALATRGATAACASSW